MTEMFTREGQAVRVPEGAKTFARARKCGRCGGAGGSDKWAHRPPRPLRRPPSSLPKRPPGRKAENASLIARAAPYMVHAEGGEAGFIERVMEKALAESRITEAQAAAVSGAIDKIEETARRRAASGYVGKVGGRIELEVTVERVFQFERPKFGASWLTETVNIVTMRDAEGNAIVSKSPSFWSEEGRQFTIRATVKEHGTYKGECQTIVARVAVKERKGASGMSGWITITIDEGDEEETFKVPSKFEVCSECEGHGTDRGRSVECDGGGFTASEWNEICAEDDEFAENYFSGRYDRTCECCKGLRVVQVIDRDLADPNVIKRYDEKMQFDAENAAMRQAEMRMGC
jgi:hypothetical protein